MGQHSKRSRTTAAAAALTATGAMAASAVVALPGAASAAPAERIPEHLTPATTTTAVVHAAKPAGSTVRTYKVRPGDWLSSIAQRFCGSPSRWPNLWGANFKTVGANPNMIYPGELLQLACRAAARFLAAAPVTTAAVTPSPDNDSDQAPAQHAAAPVTVTGFSGGSVSAAYSAFPGASCIVTRESGGDATAQNPDSTASGLFQDLQTTWNGYGGYSEAKYAPVSVQIKFNQELYATAGLSPWAADGCPGT